LIVRSVDAVLAVGGAYGTLSEIALALVNSVPVVGLDTWAIEGVQTVASPGVAVRRVLELAGDRRAPRLG
jgi:predicted Rossmann-fold nucleotide-binding protein